MNATETVTVIGVGNPYRRDDGVGITVARRLRERIPTGVVIIEESDAGADMLEAWKGAVSVFLVDAVLSGAHPGTVHRLDARNTPIPGRFFHCSTHAFNLAETVELARALNELPTRLIVFGIEGEDFTAGVGLSAEVEQAATSVIERLLEETHRTSVFDAASGVAA